MSAGGSARMLPLAWGLPAGIGVLVAALLGSYEPGWGIVLSFPAATLVIAIGTIREPQDTVLPMTLRMILSATIGFTACTVAVTLRSLSDARVDPTLAAQLRGAFVIRWVIMVSLVPLGVAALAVRRRRRRVEGTEEPT